MPRTRAIIAACLLISNVAVADPLTDRVDAPGVGVVKMIHAMQTCLDDKPHGDVTAAEGNHREPAFQEIAKALLDTNPATRGVYWKHHDGVDWPTVPIEASYLGEVSWVPAGVIGSCQATGLYFVMKGIEIAEACTDDKKACEALFMEHEHEILAEALKATKKEKYEGTGTDKFFQFLAGQGDLETWLDPAPFLEKACAYPDKAMESGLFIDPSDLKAARWACMQQLVLGNPTDELAPLDTPCQTAWVDVSEDAERVATVSITDLGVSGTVVADRIQKRLYRMDNSVETCPGDFADYFRRSLLPGWRTAQTERACSDKYLLPPDRVHLCPQLPELLDETCDGGEVPDCMLLSELALEGIGMEKDEERGILARRRACEAEDADACTALKEHSPTIAAWIAVQIAAEEEDGDGTQLDKALELIADWTPLLGDDFEVARVQAVFDRAVEVEAGGYALTFLAEYEEKLPEEWIVERRETHAELLELAQEEADKAAEEAAALEGGETPEEEPEVADDEPEVADEEPEVADEEPAEDESAEDEPE